jgi:hypothetical protein
MAMATITAAAMADTKSFLIQTSPPFMIKIDLNNPKNGFAPTVAGKMRTRDRLMEKTNAVKVGKAEQAYLFRFLSFYSFCRTKLRALREKKPPRKSARVSQKL